MKYLIAFIFAITPLISNAQTPNDEPLSTEQEISEYCASLVEDGTSKKEEADQIKACIEEQTANESEQSDTAPEADTDPTDPVLNACYEKVDAFLEKQVEKNTDANDNYESLLNDCVNGKMP